MSPERTLPMLDLIRNSCESPHVVVLGAGASVAALPHGDANGSRLPLMNNLEEAANLGPILSRNGMNPPIPDFEAFFSQLSHNESNRTFLSEIEEAIEGYFRQLQLPDKPNLYDYLIHGNRTTFRCSSH